MTPALSVIVRNRNRAAVLPRALDSILAQTVSDLEIVLVDDASTDDSVARVRARYGALPGLRLVELPRHGGAGAAAAAGLAAARGTYVAFLDSDDEWLPGHLARHLAALAASGACVSHGDFIQVQEDYGIERPVRGRSVEDARTEVLRGGFIYTLSVAVARRDALLAAGGFDPALPLAEDFDLWLRVAFLREDAFVHVPGPTVRHYQRDDAATRDFAGWYDYARAVLERAYARPEAVPYRHLRAQARHRIGVGIVARQEATRVLRQPPMHAVSVVARAAGGRADLARTLRSVAAQSYVNVEVLVIDDAPGAGAAVAPDEDWQVLRFEQPVAPAAAFNHGVLAASGVLVACIDAGDEWEPDFLLALARTYAHAPAPPVFAYCDRVSGTAAACQRPDYGSAPLLHWHLLNAVPAGAATCMFRREDVLAAGCQDETLPVAPELGLALHLLARAGEHEPRRVPAYVARALVRRGTPAGDAAGVDEARARQWLDRVLDAPVARGLAPGLPLSRSALASRLAASLAHAG